VSAEVPPTPTATKEPLDDAALRRWWCIDTTLAVYFIGSALVVLLGAARIPHAPWVACGYLGALALYLGLKRAVRSCPRLVHAYLWSPLLLVIATFESLGLIIPHLREARMDATLANIDLALFGSDPTRWFEPLLGPASAALLQLCYTSYYFVPILLIVLVWRRGAHRTVLRYGGMLVSCFFATYVGYYLVPAAGPRAFFTYEEPLPLGPVTEFVHDLLDRLEAIKLDAFPSGHTAIAVLSLSLLFSEHRRLAWAMTPLVVGLVVSTVALRYHYAIDVLAGLALAAVWATWGRRLVLHFDRKPLG
jgi:membrane-associated phospholipid phosphatase